MSSKVKVNVKWGKQLFSNLEADLDAPPLLFKSQLFALTNVPVERQKVMLKGLLKDDDDWGTFKSAMKDGVTLMLTGTAEPLPQAPVKPVLFAEDLPESEQQGALEGVPKGLVNLDNSCYFNATVQCLAHVPELVDSVAKFRPQAANDPSQSIIASFKTVFESLKTSSKAVVPAELLTKFRLFFPQFGEMDQGRYKQQDAEEAWTQVMQCLKSLPKISDTLQGQNSVDQLFQTRLSASLKCIDAPDEPEEIKEETVDKISCFIGNDTNFLSDGLRLSFDEKISKKSPTLNAEANYKKISRLAKLPYYLPIQFVRFFWKKGEKPVKAKIVRPVEFPLELDVHEFCSDSLKKELEPQRQKLVAAADKNVDPDITLTPLVNDHGYYELVAVLTHKGLSADGGHYTAWIKDADNNRWLLFDDDTVTVQSEDEIKKLNGKTSAQWHMAYICLYKTKTNFKRPPPADKKK